MQLSKAPGNDSINIGLVEAEEHELWKTLVVRFSWYLAENAIPQQLEEIKNRSVA